ncbi:MAG TPA: hypothetical protein VKT30_04655 [Caulobacteraceae bacterium]|nr:hypothetical protein [Caulobacteraceae bacterium]
MLRNVFRTTAAALAVTTALGAVAPAWAQDGYGPPPPPPGPGYQGGPYNMPPPEGYSAEDQRYDESQQAREEDERYSYEAERWAAANCIAARENSTAAGAVIGGILGAVIGGAAAGRYDRGAGIVAGGALGALAGGAIGNAQASENNPNCPPGYVLREGAPAFYPGPVYGEVVYEAPGWYDPWEWYGGHWIYRPYPYHRFWYEHEHERGFDHDRGEHGDRGWDHDRDHH